MKKLRFFCFSLVTLFLMLISIAFGGVDASAYTYNPSKPGEDFTPYKDQIVYCDLTQQEGQFADDGSYGVYLYIDDLNDTFQFNKDIDFHPIIISALYNDQDWTYNGFYNLLGTEELYWNPWAQYWQIDYPEGGELEYLRERVNVLEELVTNLSNQLHLRNVEIQSLYGEINTLLNEIQYLENALESEYERGYNEGMLVTESEAYERGFRDGEKIKLAENNEKFYNGIEKWLVPAIITVIALGGFVTIASIKRREQ